MALNFDIGSCDTQNYVTKMSVSPHGSENIKGFIRVVVESMGHPRSSVDE